ncbi:MAG: sugar isomerase [Acidimicrobiaceae bacterium]|jgi:fructoselysine-6-P-deglycase FrlB-like protein|nr:sugar isomerase [Acidimicrobiaceae bacterium]
MSGFAQEVRSQASAWRRTVQVAAKVQELLPTKEQRVCVVGCGTSLFMGQSFAAYREKHCGGETDAFPASEMPTGRRYELAVAISRSGTTTEVLDVVEELRHSGTQVLAITAVGGTPLSALASNTIVLDYADEMAVVQTRFATSALQLLLSACGWDVELSASRVEHVLASGPPLEIQKATQFVFVGRGMAVGIASEAALKLRESARAWTEAYPSMEFRHGPISAIGDQTVVWSLDAIEPGLAAQIQITGASVVSGQGDPVAELVRVHLAAEQLAAARGLDPNAPLHLTRSVILDR